MFQSYHKNPSSINKSVQHTWDALTLFAFTKLGVNDCFRQCTFSELCTNTRVALGARTNLPPGRVGGSKIFTRTRGYPPPSQPKMAAEGERNHMLVYKRSNYSNDIRRTFVWEKFHGTFPNKSGLKNKDLSITMDGRLIFATQNEPFSCHITITICKVKTSISNLMYNRKCSNHIIKIQVR